MKKLSALLACLLLLQAPYSWAIFNLPVYNNDIFYPSIPFPPFGNGKIVHSSCLDHFYYDNSECQAWAWNPEGYGFNSPAATIAWRMYDPVSGMIQGTIDPTALLSGSYTDPLISEIEVATYEINGDKFLVAAFYLNDAGVGQGHFYETFKWDPFGGTFLYAGLTQLSSVSGYTRISIDEFKGYAIAFTWQDGNYVMVKTGLVNPGSGTLDMSNDIRVINSYSGVLPDIAFGTDAYGGLLVRIAYLTSGDFLNVSNLDFYAVQTYGGSSLNFTIDDSWTTSYDYSIWSTNVYKIDFTETYFQLDCPANGTMGDDRWTVIYHDNPYDITARMSSFWGIYTPVLSNIYGTLSATDKNIFPTLVYGTSDKIYFGWMYQRGGADSAFIGLMTNGMGTPVGSLTDYNIISQYGPVTNTPLGGPTWHDIICFAKYIESAPFSPNVFIVQSTADPNYYTPDPPNPDIPPTLYTITKTVPVGSPLFRPAGISNMPAEASVVVYPNPSHNDFILKSDDANAPYSVSVWSINGRCITKCNGNLKAINERLKSVSRNLVAGSYYIKVKGADVDKTFPVVKL